MAPHVFQNANACVPLEFLQSGNNALLLVKLNASPVVVPTNCPQRTRTVLPDVNMTVNCINLPMDVDKNLPTAFVKTAHQATVAPETHEKNVKAAEAILH